MTGAERKRLVEAIAAYTNMDAAYLGAPSFAYQVGGFNIDRNGIVSFDGQADSKEIEGLIAVLTEQGFTVHEHNLGCEEPDDTADQVDCLVTQMPADSFTPEALNNLHAIIAAKGRLIRKALDTEHLPILVEDDIISFPWVNGREITDEEAGAYIHLISAICDMARNQKRITASPGPTLSSLLNLMGYNENNNNEEYTQKAGKTVSYIDSPIKLDRAL